MRGALVAERYLAAAGAALLLALGLACARPSGGEAGPGWGSRGKMGAKTCIAHRGASADAPEHTLAAYRLALEVKADFVEQDLQMSKDGALVCLHDTSLERTTNVAEVFPERATFEERDGKQEKTWLVADFTLAELKTLDAGSWFGPQFAGERIPTYQEAIDLVKGKAGIYSETKEPGYYDARGFNMEEEVVRVLAASGLDSPAAQKKTPVLLQSFSPESLKRLRELAGKTYVLIQLVSNQQAALMTDEGLAGVKKYADGIGPAIRLVTIDRTRVPAAHKLGLLVHPYTVDSRQLPDLYPDAKTYTDFLVHEVGADGVFTNNPDQFPRY